MVDPGDRAPTAFGTVACAPAQLKRGGPCGEARLLVDHGVHAVGSPSLRRILHPVPRMDDLVI